MHLLLILQWFVSTGRRAIPDLTSSHFARSLYVMLTSSNTLSTDLKKSESNNFRNSGCDFHVNAMFTCIYEQRLIAFLIKDLKSHNNF